MSGKRKEVGHFKNSVISQWLEKVVWRNDKR